jgi:RNA polymerase sigma-70 factor (ECF subfamily)
MDSDEALFEQLVAGDLGAFDRLYERFERPLSGFIHAYTRDRVEAEDLLHETFMTVLRQRRAPERVRSFRAWLFAIARNLCLNQARSKKRAGRALEAVKSIAAVAPPDAEEQIEERERAASLERAVARLPAELAEVYRLRGSGMSYDEVAQVLEVPVGTVKWRVHEMVKRLRHEVGQ